jgi:two-component system nitrate/nitrite response regulator NarL
VVLGDDHAVFLGAMETALRQRGFQVSATATSPSETVAQSRLHQPDLCLLDKHFPGEHSLDVIGGIRAVSKHTKILILSADRDAEGAHRMLQAGASGYVHKSRGLHALLTAIERTRRGENPVDLPAGDPRRRSGDAENARRLAAYLTGRERECLRMLVDGHDTAAIGARLGVAPTTVRSHVQSLLSKLCVHSRLEAASFAVRYRILDEEEPRCYSARVQVRQRNRGDEGRDGRPRSGIPTPVF